MHFQKLPSDHSAKGVSGWVSSSQLKFKNGYYNPFYYNFALKSKKT